MPPLTEDLVILPDRKSWPGVLREVLSAGHGFQADVLLLETPGGPVVVKDFRNRSWWFARTLGRWLCAREVRAYARLAGLSVVPRMIQRLDAFAFAVEYRPGTLLSRSLRGRTSPGFMAELEQGLEAIHERGVVHLDLRHRSNVLAGDDGHPVILDFASALCLRPGSRRLRWLTRFDRLALEKWRVRLEPTHSEVAGEGSASSAGSSGGTTSAGSIGAKRPM